MVVKALRALWCWMFRLRVPEEVEPVKKTTPCTCVSSDCKLRGRCCMYLDVREEFPNQHIHAYFGHQLLPHIKNGKCQSYEREVQ